MIGTADIVIRLGDEEIVLHPSLRHALHLARRPGAFKQVVQDLQEGSLTTACEIIRPHYDPDHLPNLVYDYGTDRLAPKLLAYVAACAGIDGPQQEDGGKPRKSQSFEDYLVGLFRIATGWLGWTPEVTWDATPGEIVEAYKGRLDLMKSIFGAQDEAQDGDLSDRFRTMFSDLSKGPANAGR